MSSERDANWIRTERIKVVIGQTPAALAVTLINAGLTAAVLRPVTNPTYLMIWIDLLLFASAARGLVWIGYRRDPNRNAHAGRWTALATASLFVFGLLWGAGAAVLFPPSDFHRLFLVFVVGGMCAGAAALYASHFSMLLAFVLPAALPFAVRLAAEKSLPQTVSALMILIFISTVLISGYRASTAFRNTLRLQHELAGVNARLRAEIAEHRATEATLRQAQKMEAIGQLTGGIAHDFNNLLTAVIGNLDLIAHAAGGNEKIRRLTASAIAAAERGTSLTGSLLAFARLQSLSSEPTNLNTLLREFSALLEQATGDAVTLELKLDPALGMCQVDPAQFQSSILNLAINARDSMPEGGRLVIATTTVTLESADLAGNFEAEPGRFVAVSVRDTGVGMSRDVLARAFEPFFTTKDIGKGSGLGLSQVYGFARQAHGHVSIESRVGRGTTVTIYLPVREVLRAADPKVNAPSSVLDIAHSRVLMVEDNADVLDAVATSLREEGFEVVTATDGHAALRILQSDQRVDILFSDVVMPDGMSGIDLARKSRLIRPALPVLLTSGYAASSLQSDGALEDEFELMNKPYRLTDLIMRFRSVMSWSANSH